MSKASEPLSYGGYLQLDRILNSQAPESERRGQPAHDEMLFIVVHQTYELWFKQILHELDAVMAMFRDDYVDERHINVAVSRLERIVEIQKLMIDQVRILETMTPLDFLDFRSMLTPASGFQSVQFRMLEVKLGLQIDQRIRYSQEAYHQHYDAADRERLMALEREPTLFRLLETWLERTPFLEWTGFNFVDAYRGAVDRMLTAEREAVERSGLPEAEVADRHQKLAATRRHFESLLNRDEHDQLVTEGRRRLSHRATLAALFIQLYRDQPILQLPYRLLNTVVDMDELLSTWRYRHALMVLRMIGRKTGTGGSAGYSYLKSTAEQHRVFQDFFNISTLLIPRSQLPELPAELVRKLGFFWSEMEGGDG